MSVRQPCSAYRPIVRRSRVVGVLTSEGVVTAPVTIDASGSGHWMARRLALPVKRVSRRLVAWYGYAAGRCRHRTGAPELVADDVGWTWTARVRRGVYQWTRLSLARWRPPMGWLPRDLSGTRPASPARGADVSWRIVRPCAGPGFFVAGDAAAMLDPSSSHGVLNALMSGMMAGRLAAAAVNGRGAQPQISRAYRAWLSDRFDHETERLGAEYERIGLRVTHGWPASQSMRARFGGGQC